jgi:hypothetical protein
MNAKPDFKRILRCLFDEPATGVVGLVDDLLQACHEHGLELHWEGVRCRVRASREDWHDLPELPFRNSVFRAMLARVAALCNARRPNSVSPYGGQGELTVGGTARVIRVALANTATDQSLHLTPQRDQEGSAAVQEKRPDVVNL